MADDENAAEASNKFEATEKISGHLDMSTIQPLPTINNDSSILVNRADTHDETNVSKYVNA